MNFVSCKGCGIEIRVLCCLQVGFMEGYCEQCLMKVDPTAQKCSNCNNSLCNIVRRQQARLLAGEQQHFKANSSSLPLQELSMSPPKRTASFGTMTSPWLQESLRSPIRQLEDLTSAEKREKEEEYHPQLPIDYLTLLRQERIKNGVAISEVK